MNSTNSKWKVPLSKAQKLDLDKSILEYIDWHLTSNESNNNRNNELIQSLNELFQISSHEDNAEHQEQAGINKGQLLLPRKWNSIVQLQRKIMLLEDNINQLNIQLETLKEGSSSSSSNNNNNNNLTYPIEDHNNNSNDSQLWVPRSSSFNSFVVESPITAIKLHPILPIVILGTNHGKLYLYDIMNTSLPIASTYAHTKAITSIEIAQLDDEHKINIVTASKDLFIRSWIWNSIEPEKFELNKTLQDHDHIISQIVTFPHHINNSTMLASCSRDSTIKIWNLHEGWCVKTIKNAHTEWIRSIDVLGQYILSGGHDTSVRLSHWPTGNGLSIGVGHGFPIEKVLILPLPQIDNIEELDFNEKMYQKMGFKYCFTAGRDNLIKMWQIPIPSFTTNDIPIPNINPQSQQFILHKEFKGHTSWVRDMKLSHLGPFLFSCSDDNSLKMWNIDTGECIKTWANFHSGFINCIDTDIKSDDRKTRKVLVSGGIDCKCNILMN